MSMAIYDGLVGALEAQEQAKGELAEQLAEAEPSFDDPAIQCDMAVVALERAVEGLRDALATYPAEMVKHAVELNKALLRLGELESQIYMASRAVPGEPEKQA